MKTMGFIGGMSWESSIKYYQIINEAVREKLGGLHSAKSLMYSVDFGEIEKLMQQGQWESLAQEIIAAAESLEKGGADFFLICTNTVHKVAGEVQRHVSIPLLHIADATGEKVKAEGLGRIGLLGTTFTMEEEFYRGRLRDKYGLDVLIPPEPDRKIVNRVIFEELCRGQIKASSKEQYLKIMESLIQDGADGIIMGCTEIGLLVNASDTRVPLFDTTEIHARAAVAYALEP